MDQGHAAGDRLQVEDPVERRIAAAGHHHPPVAECLHLADGVEERGALEGLGTRQRDAPRHEAAGPGGDHHDRCLEDRPQRRLEPPPAVVQTLQALGLLAEMEHRLERLDLLHQIVDQLLARAARHGRDVVDRLVGIELGTLAADLVEVVHELAAQAEEAGLEHGEEAHRTGADDHHVGADDILGHDRYRCPLALALPMRMSRSGLTEQIGVAGLPPAGRVHLPPEQRGGNAAAAPTGAYGRARRLARPPPVGVSRSCGPRPPARGRRSHRTRCGRPSRPSARSRR